MLDLDPRSVNREMVDLDPLEEEDRAFLLDVLRRHVDETDSGVAAALLADPEAALARFTKVMPRDYKRVLAARLRALREGVDVDVAVMEASNG